MAKKENTVKAHIIPRSGTAADWTLVNPVLLAGELGVETDTGRFKFGNGDSTWSVLPYSDKEVRELIESAKTSLDESLTDIRDMIKDGATLDEAKAALLALGPNYKNLYTLATTIKTFLEASDTSDDTINTWREIEDFLQGLTDRDSLTGLMEQEHQKIKKDFEEKLSVLDDSFVTLDTGQTIPASKTFDNGFSANKPVIIKFDNPDNIAFEESSGLMILRNRQEGKSAVFLGDTVNGPISGLAQSKDYAYWFYRETPNHSTIFAHHPRKTGTVALLSDLASKVSSSQVKNIAGPMTAAQYAALTPDENTLYIIID